MKLTAKITLIFFLFWLFLLVSSYLTYDRVVKPAIYDFEKSSAKEKLERFSRTLKNEMGFFHKFCADYARWDDTYEYMKDKNEEYIKSNFSKEAFTENQFNLAIIVNNEGKVLFGKWLDLETGESKNLPMELSTPLWALTHPLLRFPDVKEGKVGFWKTTYGILLISSHKILPSKGEGAPAGTLIFGRLITPQFWDKISDHTLLNLDLIDYLEKSKYIKDNPKDDEFPIFIYANNSEINVYQIIYDLYNKPLLIVKIVHPLNVLKAGRLLETRAALYFLIIIGVGLTIMWLTVQRNIVLPIRELTKHIQNSAYQAVISTYPTPERNDEVALLIFHFNRMAHKINKLVEETQRWNKLLEERERYFRTLLNVVPCGIVELSERGEIETANDTFKELINLNDKMQSLEKMLIYEVIKSQQIENFISNKTGDFFESEESIQIGNHGVKYIHYKFKKIERNEKIYFIGLIWDITNFKEIQEKLETQKRLALLGEASASLAHELRNMVSAVQSGFMLLLEETNIDKRSDIIEELKSLIFRLEDTLRKLLDFTRVYKLEKKKVPVGLIVREQFQNCVISMGRTSKYEIEINGESEVYVDPSLLSRAFFNIIKNSIEAMPDGGKITVSILDNMEWVQISIKDYGKGIEPELIEKIGKPFFTTKSKGTGLGMAIVFKIIESHKGKIDIESEINKGTKITITLPKLEA
ncbi:MAG: ATP-binding protein [Candidatus Hydrogenedentes bacterium]|nr:ATP-binding protein [Candidatus Hydrogenedentota bacterium]